jgi:hypothetical protein
MTFIEPINKAYNLKYLVCYDDNYSRWTKNIFAPTVGASNAFKIKMELELDPKIIRY